MFENKAKNMLFGLMGQWFPGFKQNNPMMTRPPPSPTSPTVPPIVPPMVPPKVPPDVPPAMPPPSPTIGLNR
ncbi:hypothetical protein GOBAR_DD01043 [Gossypium barbadense]|nr:hypothetical protein GOBAR_DD01043 [Gossypium barbadense]